MDYFALAHLATMNFALKAISLGQLDRIADAAIIISLIESCKSKPNIDSMAGLEECRKYRLGYPKSNYFNSCDSEHHVNFKSACQELDKVLSIFIYEVGKEKQNGSLSAV